MSGAVLRRRDWAEVADAFRGSGAPRHVVVDDLLTEEALLSLREQVTGDDRWAFPHEGSTTENLTRPAPDLTRRIAEELVAALPGVLGSMAATDCWAIRCHRSTGLRVHTDTGAVTLNLYLTADEHNLSPGRGGLVLAGAQRPAEVSLLEYNHQPWGDAYFARADDGRRFPLAYRCNRAVLFDSRTFHASDRFEFADRDAASLRTNLGMVFDEPVPAAERREVFATTLAAMRARAESEQVALGTLSLERAEEWWSACLPR